MKKYIRKTVAVILTLLFCVALVICAGVILSVKNVNVSYNDKTGSFISSYLSTEENFDKLKGGSILLLDEDDVSACLSDSTRLKVESYQKVYPCSVNIVLTERVETFSAYDGSGYEVYDEDGAYMFRSAVNTNTVDLSPNVLIEYGMSESDRAYVVEVCGVFKESFSSLRQLVESVEKQTTPEYELLVFTLRTGLVIEYYDCDNLLAEKISASRDAFATLSDAEKTHGKIRCYGSGSSSAAVSVVYSA